MIHVTSISNSVTSFIAYLIANQISSETMHTVDWHNQHQRRRQCETVIAITDPGIRAEKHRFFRKFSV